MSNNNNFYVLKEYPDDYETPVRTDFLDIEVSGVGDAPCCSACGNTIGALSWLPPYMVEIETWGKGFGDFAFGPHELIVSERFKSLYEKAGLLGLEDFEPVEIVRVKRYRRFRGKPPQYYHVRVAYSQAVINQAKSGFEWEQPPTCSVCRRGHLIMRWRRIVIEPGTWSGEEIFIARGLGGTYLVSKRFKNFCEEHEITNAVLVPAEEYAHDFYPLEQET